ncbi:hypothetical protein SK128_020628, partial [Halocaridina rubra]
NDGNGITGPETASGAGMADVFFAPCSAFCAEKPDEDCTAVDGGCCMNYICGDLPRNCTTNDGLIYVVGDSWEESKCRICNCYYSSSSGAYESCYRNSYCSGPPHKDCISLGTPENKCCEHFSCKDTTCQHFGRYYGIGDTWTSRADPCQQCKCVKNSKNPPNIECEATKCPSPPQPYCRAITYVDECCAQSWDCTDDYLITMAKKWVKGEAVPICVFTTSSDVDIDLSFLIEGGTSVTSSAVLKKNGISEFYTCVNASVPVEAGRKATLTISGKVGEASISKSLDILTANVEKTFVQTDKFLYMPGQTVKFRILTMIGTQILVSYDDIPSVWILAPTGSRLMQWTSLKNPQGILHLEFSLAEEVEEGEYKIQVNTTGGKISSQIFRVQEYVLPRFEVTVTAPARVLSTITEIPIQVCAKYTYGKPVKGSVTIMLEQKQYYYWYGERKAISVETFNSSVNGCWNALVSTKDFNNEYISRLSVTTTFIEEGTNVEINGTTSVTVVHNMYSFRELSNEGYHKPGLPYSLKVKITREDGADIAGEIIKTCVLSSCKKFTLDKSGILDIIIPSHILGIDSSYITVDVTTTAELWIWPSGQFLHKFWIIFCHNVLFSFKFKPSTFDAIRDTRLFSR